MVSSSFIVLLSMGESLFFKKTHMWWVFGACCVFLQAFMVKEEMFIRQDFQVYCNLREAAVTVLLGVSTNLALLIRKEDETLYKCILY